MTTNIRFEKIEHYGTRSQTANELYESYMRGELSGKPVQFVAKTEYLIGERRYVSQKGKIWRV